MAAATTTSHNLFEVYLRLRPSQAISERTERFLDVEAPSIEDPSAAPTHITLNPPSDRRRAVERFGFTQVFEEDATQLDVFHCTNVVKLIEGVVAPHGGNGNDALLATLGVTGSGKTHTILGSRSQRGMMQLALDVIFRSLGNNMADAAATPTLEASIAASDVSEARMIMASTFNEQTFADASGGHQPLSRAATPMLVRSSQRMPCSFPDSSHLDRTELDDVRDDDTQLTDHESVRMVKTDDYKVLSPVTPPGLRLAADPFIYGDVPSQARLDQSPTKIPLKHYMGATVFSKGKQLTKLSNVQGELHGGAYAGTPRKRIGRPAPMPTVPDISHINISSDPAAEYVVLLSMYEVYNDRVFDLLMPAKTAAPTNLARRPPLLFRPTELSPDRKVVAGLRKVICTKLSDAISVLEAGLHERRVAGTGSNSTSSRSHGFICVEVKKRSRSSSKRHEYPWGGGTLTVVDLAGSERAREAKTAGATLAEAGKINESLMYLGQCLQMQSDAGADSKPSLVPYRQCKLTELLFTNSFPSSNLKQSQAPRKRPQKAVMIVAADPLGDFNATSQILRYSALAREVTVPRIPSTHDAILQANAAAHDAQTSRSGSSPLSSPTLHNRPFFNPSSGAGNPRTFSPMSVGSEDRLMMENAALEIARLTEELKHMQDLLNKEQEARITAQAHLLSMEDRMQDLEMAIREDCMNEFEERFALEQARWKSSMQWEIERGEEHWDRKIDVYEQSVNANGPHVNVIAPSGAHPDYDGEVVEDKENMLIEDLEDEIGRLRRENKVLKHELQGRTPTKRKPLGNREDVFVDSSPMRSQGNTPDQTVRELSLRKQMDALRVSVHEDEDCSPTRRPSVARASTDGSPTKKLRSSMAYR